MSIASHKPVGRPAVKQQHVVDRLRQRIILGEWPPKSRLPVWRELSQEYEVSLMTIKAAMDELAVQGFIESRGTAGTYVANRPPHASRIAIVFNLTPDSPDFSRFLRATMNEAMAHHSSDERDLDIFYGINGHADCEDYQRLLADFRCHRLAGIYFAGSVSKWALESPLFESNDIPMIHFGPPMEQIGLSNISLNHQSFYTQALDHFVAKGCRRVALIHGPLTSHETAFIQDGLRERGLETQPYWWQRVGVSLPQSAKNVAHLLMRLPSVDRPDALLITDDNAVEYVTSGLVAANVNVPQALEVVAHCNFPWPTPSVVPVARLGFDTRFALQSGLEQLDAQRCGALPRTIDIPAIWEADAVSVNHF